MVRKGFTLSEVMVTMVILGILAAFLIPAIIKASPDTKKIMFKKAYYTLEQAVNKMVNDDISYPTVIDTGTGLERGFNFTDARANGSENKFCYYLRDQLNTAQGSTESCPDNVDDAGIGVGTFTTTDGVIWNVYIPAADTAPLVQFPINPPSYAVTITVDVNGSKAPNCSFTGITYPLVPAHPEVPACAVGTDPDTFRIGIRYDGKLSIIPVEDTAAASILADPTNNN